MPLTYTTDRILLEFCILNKRPNSSRHSLWVICNDCYLLLSISLAICISCYRISCPECPSYTPQTKFSSSFVSSAGVRTAPDTPYGSSVMIAISCYRYLLLSVSSHFLPRMPLTYTTNRILLEFCILNRRPNSSRPLWVICNDWYLLLSISFGICISCYRNSCPKCPLHTPQTEFSSSFVSSAGVRTAPDIPYGSFVMSGISCYRYLLLSVSLAIAFPAQNASYIHHRQNSLRILLSQTASEQLHTFLMGHLWWLVSLAIDISCYLYLLLSHFLPRMPLTYTTDRILFESCVLRQRPNSSRHSLWGICNDW